MKKTSNESESIAIDQKVGININTRPSYIIEGKCCVLEKSTRVLVLTCNPQVSILGVF